MPMDEKDEETEVDAYDAEHGKYTPNVSGDVAPRLQTETFPMAPKAAPFKVS